MAKKLSLILMVLLSGAIVDAKNISQNTNLPFNPNQIIEKVTENLVRENSEFNNTQKWQNINQLPDDEFLINTSIVPTSVMDDQRYPSVASDGFNYFIVWQDERNGNDDDIYGILVDNSGRTPYPTGFAISNESEDQENPCIAFDGFTYLVVWEDCRNEQYDIYGARIGRFGNLIDTNGFAISIAENHQYYPSIAFDGTNYLVVWQDGRNNYYDIYGARVNPSGVVLDPNGFAISIAEDYQRYPSIAFDGTNYLVVWQDGRNNDYDIYGARVNPSGVVLDTNGFAISIVEEHQYYPSLAFDGTNYLVVWQDRRNNDYDIYGARVNPSGVVLDTNGFVISIGDDYQLNPSITFDGTNYFVVWQERTSGDYGIYGSRVNPDGIVLDTAGFAISTVEEYQTYPSVTFGYSSCLVVWEDERNDNDDDIYGARVSPSGIVLDPTGIVISTAANNQYLPAISFDGTNYFVVWEDYRGDNDIYGTRITQSGVILDTNGIAISTAIGRQEEPCVSFDGINYLVAWTDFRSGETSHIYVARVNRDGLVLDPVGMLISNPAYIQNSPSIGFDSRNYLIVWEERRSNNNDIYGTRLTPTGLVLDPAGIPISTASDRQMDPSLAFDGANYLVVWNDVDLYGARVSTSGVVIDPDGIAICTTRYSLNHPSVCYKNTNYLVVWEDHRNQDRDIYGARVNPSGVVFDTNGFAISTAEEDQENPFVAFSDTNFIVVWQHERNDYFDIYGAKVSPSGVVIDSFPISTQEGNQYSPVCFCKIEEQMLITYSGWTETVQNRTYNAERIWGKFYSLIGIQEDRKPLTIDPLSFEIYPNPAKSYLAIRLPSNADRQAIKIFDVSGKLIKVIDKVTSTQEHKQEIKTSLKGINQGIYFLRLGMETKKFIVTK